MIVNVLNVTNVSVLIIRNIMREYYNCWLVHKLSNVILSMIK